MPGGGAAWRSRLRPGDGGGLRQAPLLRRGLYRGGGLSSEPERRRHDAFTAGAVSVRLRGRGGQRSSRQRAAACGGAAHGPLWRVGRVLPSRECGMREAWMRRSRSGTGRGPHSPGDGERTARAFFQPLPEQGEAVARVSKLHRWAGPTAVAVPGAGGGACGGASGWNGERVFGCAAAGPMPSVRPQSTGGRTWNGRGRQNERTDTDPQGGGLTR